MSRFGFASILFTAALLAQGPGPGGPGTGGGVGAAVLTAEDQKNLVFMREEEKLARDVYAFLAAKWNLRIFSNINRSEQTHFNLVGRTLERYGIADPAAGKAAGEFNDPTLATLYAQLITKGALSIRDALEVGVLIEKTDIADLETALAATKSTELRRIFTNLMNASYNHLDAFETVLEVIPAGSN